MRIMRCALFASLVLLVSPALRGQATESSINKQLKNLRAVPAPPGMAPSPNAISEAQRPGVLVQVARDIGSLPAVPAKLKLADELFHATTEGAASPEAVQGTADTLTEALTESPQPEKDGTPATAYFDLAKLVRYAGATTTSKDPELVKAAQTLLANDAEIAKLDFMLKDSNSKKVTLSGLKGKIVLVNFWSTQCTACAGEMANLDLIYTHYKQQGLAILSITQDNPFLASSFLASKGYHPTVLFDDGGKVGKQFHVDELHPENLPRTFVFDRDGKLVGESIATSTQRQFFEMLGQAGLQPGK